MEAAASEPRLEFGKLEFGCQHYRRRCKIRAPCCGEVFGCRHCHNEATAKNDRHELPRHDVKRVICLVCDTEQPAAKVCSNCGVNMGEYYCDVCKFYDDIVSPLCHLFTLPAKLKNNSFTVMTVASAGGRENYFHCQKCGSCYVNDLRDRHLCVENSMKHQCPICCEYLFDSLRETRILDCGHTMHFECFHEMLQHNQYTCPICYKSAINMTSEWRNLDDEVSATIMPEDYRYKVWIFCNDCHETSEVYFHVLGQKCCNCKSYNTRTTGPPATQSAL
ncbi:hypothetical protein LUZ63_011922 [Rhynchospora breviuscula]|uniref:Uncharacterized protein n=1 Tax=Rhynchospora breviuscula TaxID=2022672 RepID=A0A9Q0CKP4_9POAL|nr:hypothetical protein LUZ63_011922 [Rhynchospora breviuscula]